MAILGRFLKQLTEVEVWSIQFIKDLDVTDHLVSTFTIIAPYKGAIWDQVTRTAEYTALSSDDGKVFVTTSNVNGYVGANEGFKLYVSNKSQNSSIVVCGFVVPARGAIVVRRSNGAWVSEASTSSVMVDVPGDQRVRTFMTGGVANTSYEIQVAVTTNEGRTLQDEFIVKIREV